MEERTESTRVKNGAKDNTGDVEDGGGDDCLCVWDKAGRIVDEELHGRAEGSKEGDLGELDVEGGRDVEAGICSSLP